MIRTISLILIIATFFPVLLLPVSAAGYVSPQHDVIDFLTSASYSVYKGTSLQPSAYFADYPIPKFYASGSKSYIFAWSTSGSVSCSSFYVTILATSQPSSVGYVNATQSISFTALTYVGTSTGANGLNRYFYRIDNKSLSNVNLALRIQFSSTYAGNLGIESFIGYADNVYSISYVDYEYYRVYSAKPDNAASDGFTWNIYDSGFDYITTFFLDEFWWGEDPGEYREPLRFDAFYTIDLADFPILSNAYIRFFSLGLLGDISISLVDEYGTIVYAVPDYSISNSVASSYFNTNFATFDLYNYFLSVDLSGYDLTGLYLRFNFSTPYLMASSLEELSYAYGGLYDVSVSVPTTDRAWYAGIVDFFKGILESFMDIVRGLVDWVVDLYNACIDFFANLLSNLNDYFLYFVDWGEQVIGSLTGTEEDQAEAEQFEQESQKSQQDLTDLSGKMEAVDRPDIDNINISVDTYIPSQGVNVLTAPFQVIFNNSYIFKILIVSFTMALVSYVFFGKR